MADQFTRETNSIIKGTGPTGILRYLLTPATTGVPAVGVVLTTGAGAWGVYADLIAALAITVEHWICGFFVNTLGAAQIFEVQVRDATPATLTEFRVDPTAVTANLGYIPAGPYPIWRAANAQTQARAGGAAAKVIGVSTLYTTGL
ncbi:MAG: hypothetical protein PHU23_00135 [Dehalococcoidales bacterium]|nr:hypothetical protein [Dehalococcoidales bacterium]